MTDVNSLIMGNSIPSCRFPRTEVGRIAHEGTIVALDVMQARNYATGEPDFWKDGQPKMQAVLTIQTQERDAEIENDNGVRRLFVSSKGMKDAISAAVKKAGKTKIDVGGTIGVKYLRDDPEGKNPDNLPKIYGAKYEPPPAGSEFVEPEPDDEYGEEPF